MRELVLTNCRDEPLAAYLRGLGVLRLAGEQLDPAIRGRWTAAGFALSGVDREELLGFLLERYRPTPLVAPWNKDSGFWPGRQAAGLAAVERSTGERLAAYREAIRVGRELVAWLEATGRPLNRHKAELVERCRAELPDEAVAWIDVAIVLTSGGMRFPPLLGTGGSVGRHEFSSNFMQHLAEVLCLRTGRGASKPADSRRWLEAALFAEVDAARKAGLPIGQFDPGSAGGANSSPFGDAPSLVNPWEYVLLLEGALLFASAAARRLGTAGGPGGAALPFMVQPSLAGYASAAEGEKHSGELWAPLWERPATAREVASLLGEGRASWGRRQARTGLDLARAAASLGVDRGISAFVRYAFVERFGQAMLAVPVGRVRVRERERPEVSVLRQLDGWVDGLRQAVQGRNPPAAVASALRRVERAMMAVALHGGAGTLQSVLTAAAEAEVAASRATQFRERANLKPVAGLAARDWLGHLDDGTPELRVAAALASQHDPGGEALRLLLRPVQRKEGRKGASWLEWAQPAVPGFGTAPLPAVLAAALARRCLEVQARARGSWERGGEEARGVRTAYQRRIAAPLEDVLGWLDGRLDEQRLERLLAGLLLLDWGKDGTQAQVAWPQPSLERPPHPAYALLAPFFHGRPFQRGTGGGEPLRLAPEASWPLQLASNSSDQLRQVIRGALRGLRARRLDPVPLDAGLAARGIEGQRLAMALLCPISSSSAAALLRRTVPVELAAPERNHDNERLATTQGGTL